MTCTTCHNPHQALRGKEAMGRYTSVCQSCHASAHASGMPAGGSNCIDCHMPKRRAEDALHVVMTDHYIQRRKPPRDEAAALPETVPAPYPGEVAHSYPEQLPPTPLRDLYLATAATARAANL